jgi:hypothetical protein
MIILQDKAVTPPTKSVPEIGTTNKIILFLFTSHHLRQTCVYEHGRDLSPSLFGEVKIKTDITKEWRFTHHDICERQQKRRMTIPISLRNHIT